MSNPNDLDIAELREMVWDMFQQACHSDSPCNYPKAPCTYSHGFIGVYEGAQNCCIRWGFLKPEQCEMNSWETRKHD